MTRVVGIINVTPDSFSDGALYEDPRCALRHARDLLRAGADELDVGGESTRPGASPVDVDEECARVLPVIAGLRAAQIRVPVSIDTVHVQTARRALDAGADAINDVSGFQNPRMRALAAQSGARCIVMAPPLARAGSYAAPKEGTDAGKCAAPGEAPAGFDLDTVADFLLGQASLLEQAGVARERIALDPGFGFRDTRADDIRLFGQTPALIARLARAGFGVYAGLSRKRFLKTLFGACSPAELDQASAELSAVLGAAGAAFLRVHDAASTRDEICRLNAGPAQTAYVALGSNLGDCEANLRAALRWLSELPVTTLDATAPLYLSEPAYYNDQQPFYNTVARLRTHLGPRALFAELQAWERLAGRVKTTPNGPRIIDMDLLSYDKFVLDTAALTLPHPRIAQRAFVVEPLLVLDSDYRFPTGERLTRTSERYGAIIEVRPALMPD